MNNELKRAIRANVTFSNYELDFVVSFFKVVQLKPKQNFLLQGKKCDSVAFVQSGTLRAYSLNDRGEESACYFAHQNEFITSTKSFHTQLPSTLNIEAIKPTELLVISKQDLEQIYFILPKMQEFTIKEIKRMMLKAEEHAAMFVDGGSDQRYSQLLTQKSKFAQSVPKQYFTSLIGVSPQYLRLLRKKIKKFFY